MLPLIIAGGGLTPATAGSTGLYVPGGCSVSKRHIALCNAPVGAGDMAAGSKDAALAWHSREQPQAVRGAVSGPGQVVCCCGGRSAGSRGEGGRGGGASIVEGVGVMTALPPGRCRHEWRAAAGRGRCLAPACPGQCIISPADGPSDLHSQLAQAPLAGVARLGQRPEH